MSYTDRLHNAAGKVVESLRRWESHSKHLVR